MLEKTAKIQGTQIEHARLLMSQRLSPCGNCMQISTVGLHLVVKNCQSLPFLVMEVLVELEQMLSDFLVRQLLVYRAQKVGIVPDHCATTPQIRTLSNYLFVQSVKVLLLLL